MIRWFLRLLAGTEDPSWKPTGIRSVFTGHDEQLGQQGYQRYLKRTATVRGEKPKSRKRADVEVLAIRRRA